QRQPPAGQFYGMTPDMPLALARESAGGQIAQRNDDHDHADQPQAVAADSTPRGQGDHAEREDDSAQPQVTEPVGDDTETEYPGDGGHIQTKPGIQAKTQGDAAYQSIEIEIEGVADEHQGQHLAHRQRMP